MAANEGRRFVDGKPPLWQKRNVCRVGDSTSGGSDRRRANRGSGDEKRGQAFLDGRPFSLFAERRVLPLMGLFGSRLRNLQIRHDCSGCWDVVTVSRMKRRPGSSSGDFPI